MPAFAITKHHILVVDDDSLVSETVSMLLKADGHAVQIANSGAQALALFELGKFDLVITDFFMPAMTGDKLAAAIKTLSPSQPIMMLTAYPEKLQAGGVSLCEIDCYLGKPFEITSLRAAITTSISARNPDPALVFPVEGRP